MLPNLNQLTLVPTAGNLGNAEWPEEEVCSICTFALARPSEDERYPWPFPGEGGGFTTVACVQGHAFHKGCLRFMQRFQDKKCPDCRKPMFAEVLKDVSRPTQEELDERRRQREQQAEQRARAREQREREEREERARLEALPVAQARWAQEDAHEVTFDENDHAVQWSFFVKGHLPNEQTSLPIWVIARRFFAHHMRAEWPWTTNPIENWGQRLGIQVLHGNSAPRDMPAQTDLLAFTRCRFRLHLPEVVAERFADWLTGTIGRWGYVTAMDRVLGIRPAQQAGQAVAVMTGINDEDTDATVATMHSQENAGLQMTWQEYQEWLPFQQRTAPVAALPVSQARWAEEPSDPLMREMMLNEAERGHFSSVVERNTARTFIRFRFWLKGTMTAEEVWNATFELKDNFGRWMGTTSRLPPLPRDGWANRLGARIVPERLSSIVGAGDPNSYENRNALQEVLRCEFVLQLDDATAAVFLAEAQETMARGSNWPTLAGEWFRFASIRAASPGRDEPRVNQYAPLGSVPQPEMTPSDFVMWSPWRRLSMFVPPPAPARAPARQANWMTEEALAEMRASDPIANFRPAGGANTDVTIRWRFFLKGTMTGVQASDTPMHWRRSFADLMYGVRELPRLRTSVDPWFDRLWMQVFIQDQVLTPAARDGIERPVVRVECALKLPADVASAWLQIVNQDIDATYWDRVARDWFYVEPVKSTWSRDRPHLAPPGATLHPLSGMPRMTQAEYNAWEPWRNIQRFRAIGEDRH